MRIKKESILKVGEVIPFVCEGFDINVGKYVPRRKILVEVKEIYSHWILGTNVFAKYPEKIVMQNVDLLYQGVYKTEDVLENIVYAPSPNELSKMRQLKLKGKKKKG